MICSVIGHRDVQESDELKIQVKAVFKQLIIRGVDTFLIGSRGSFNGLSLKCLRELRQEYPSMVKIVYVRAEYEYIDDDYRQYLLQVYDDTYMPECVKKAKKAVYIVRNKFMIDNSEICVFYCNKNKRGKSGTLAAYSYAEKKNKQIINIFQ